MDIIEAFYMWQVERGIRFSGPSVNILLGTLMTKFMLGEQMEKEEIFAELDKRYEMFKDKE